MTVVSSAPDILTCAVRDYDPATDEACVYKAWLNSYQAPAMRMWALDARSYYRRMRMRVDALLRRGADLRMAVDPDDRNVILGWGCAEPPVLHYVYVKEAYRHQGIALTLLAALGLAQEKKIVCTHWTLYADAVAEKHPRLLVRCELF